MFKISVNQNECIGCGSCISCDPETFEMDENFRCKFKKGKIAGDSALVDLSPEQLKKTKEAAEICPTQGITISEA